MRVLRDVPTILLCGAVLMSTAGCSEPESAETVLRPVRTEIVRAGSGERTRSFAGVAKAGFESQLSFRVVGTVVNVPVSVGQRVSRGQLLARIDPTDYELQVQEALAGLAQAAAAERNAEAEYDRVRGLYENENASLRELDGARANAESSRALVQAAEKRLQLVRQQLSYTSLRAPVDGTVASVDVDVNENVAAGQQVLLLTAGTEIEVEVALPGTVISDVQIGDKVNVSFNAMPERPFTATVTEAGVAAVGSATTFPVTVRLEETESGIRSGMAGEVAFDFAPAAGNDSVRVSAVAVGEDREGRFVFVLERQSDGVGTVHRRAVEVGQLVGEQIEILNGISEGDELVTAGVRRLSDGLKVKASNG